jgi:hypothetical protein
MSEAFYAFVRGTTDEVPAGYALAGMKVYRYLVYLGASQMIEACHPDLRAQIGENDWRTLIEDFVRQSAWISNFYGDLENEFNEYLAKMAATDDECAL